MTLAGVVKDIFLVILSVTFFKSPVSNLQIIGYSIALAGLNAHKEYKKDPESMTKFLLTTLFCGVLTTKAIKSVGDPEVSDIGDDVHTPLVKGERA